MMIPVENLRSAVARYLSGDAPLHEVEDWAVEILIDGRSSREDTKLAGAVQLLISEWSRGDRSLDSLRAELGEYVAAVARS